MAGPVQLPSAAHNQSCGGVTYHIQGELVPVLQVELGQVPVYFEHHVLLWKEPTVEIGLKHLQGAFKRMLAGMPILMTEARGPGRIAFSRDGAGQVFAIHLRAGQSIEVREHQFLAATGGIEYSFARVQGVANMLFGDSGFFVDTFHCPTGEGVVWLHGYGNVFEVTLADGEQIDIEPGGWICKDSSVRMDAQLQRLPTGLFAGTNLVWNRFTGPGRVALQSMYLHLPSSS